MGCPDIPVVDINGFIVKVMENAISQHIPLKGMLEITHKCNLRCAHCYLDHAAKETELSGAEYHDIIDQAVDEGCLWVLITGGEPLVHKDFFDIYTHAKKRGLIIHLFTNGTLIDDETADFFDDWRPFSIEVSLYGATEETYERVTKVKGSYKRCVSGVERLLERGFKPHLKTMALNLNKHEVFEMKALAKSMGLTFRYDTLINPMIDGSREPLKAALTPEEIAEFDAKDEDRRQAWYTYLEKFSGPRRKTGLIYTCGAGRKSFMIDPYGKMGVCVLSRAVTHDLRQASFAQGWREVFPKIISQKSQTESKCQTCEMHLLCHQCPGWSYLYTGDPGAPVDHLCRIGQLRAEALGLNTDAVGAETVPAG